jgi:hypothetical protein
VDAERNESWGQNERNRNGDDWIFWDKVHFEIGEDFGKIYFALFGVND